MSLIDAHIHVTKDGSWFGTGHDASVDRALREMDSAGIEMAGLIPLADSENRDFVREVARQRTDRFFAGFTIASLDQNEQDELRISLEAGEYKFIKVHPRMSGIPPLAPGLSPFFDLAEAHNIPVVFCTYMRGTGIPIADLAPLVFDTLARRRPKMKIVLAHAGSYRPLDALAVAQSHANVYLEMSHVLEYFRGSSVEGDLIFSMGRLDRKVIFGSDFPEVSIDGYYENARKIAASLHGFESEGFFGEHAKSLFNL